MLNHGRISETGTYQELMDKGADFAKFIEEFASQKQNDETSSSDVTGFIKTSFIHIFLKLNFNYQE